MEHWKNQQETLKDKRIITAEEYVKFIDESIKTVKNAINKDNEEIKRLKILKNPIFKSYINQNYKNEKEISDTIDVLSSLIFISEKFLFLMEDYLRCLQKNPEIAVQIAETAQNRT